MVAVALTLVSSGVPGLADGPGAMSAVLTAASALTRAQEMVMALWSIAKRFMHSKFASPLPLGPEEHLVP